MGQDATTTCAPFIRRTVQGGFPFMQLVRDGGGAVASRNRCSLDLMPRGAEVKKRGCRLVPERMALPT